MKTESFSPATLAVLLLLSATTITSVSGAQPLYTNSYSYLGSTNQDVMRNFQLGNYSYELTRLGQYDDSFVCYGHQARQAEIIMDNIERVCGTIDKLSYPAQKPAGMLLRESNYFDCGRDQLRVNMIDKNDAGQQCAVGFINANGKVWVNGAQANGWKELAALGLAMALGAFAIL